MTATLGVIVVLVLGATLMIDAQSVFAQTVLSTVSTEPGQFSELPHSDHPQAAYQSGFQHGVIDGNMSSNATSYIDQPKHGFAWHTSEFVKGYVNGYCSIPANKNVGTDDDRAALYCPDGPSSAKWFIGKHEPITEGIAVVTYGIPSAGVNVTYQYYDKTSGSSGSETRMVNQTGEMHFLGYTDELVGYYPGDKVTVSVSQCITHLNAYGYPECISQPILDSKTITFGETGGIISLDLSKSAIPLVTSAGLGGAISDYQLGLTLGEIDGKDSIENNGTGTLYVEQPGKGFINQTKEFVNGYVTGYCKFNADFAGFLTDVELNCVQGPSSISWPIPQPKSVFNPQSYFQGLTEGFHDGLFDGEYHHNKSMGGTNHESWVLGYTRGWSQGCRDSGRSGENCDVQADADTP